MRLLYWAAIIIAIYYAYNYIMDQKRAAEVEVLH